MLKKILDGICEKLSSSFSEITVYTEKVEQGTKTPYFVVICEKAEFKRIVGNRFYYLNNFKITYAAEKGKSLDDFDLIYETLEHISVDGDLVKGKINGVEVVDDVITVNCSFSMIVYRVEVKEKMEVLEIN